MAKSDNYQYYRLNKYLQPELESEYTKELRDKLIKAILSLAAKELPQEHT